MKSSTIKSLGKRKVEAIKENWESSGQQNNADYVIKREFTEKKMVFSEYLLIVLYFLTCKRYQSLVVKGKELLEKNSY